MVALAFLYMSYKWLWDVFLLIIPIEFDFQ